MRDVNRLTSDNLPLSEALGLAGLISVNGNPEAPVSVNGNRCVSGAVACYVQSSLAENTKRAYASDIRQFETVAGPLPATEATVAAYIANEAPHLKVSTLIRRLASISKLHDMRGWPNPVRSQLVRSTLEGIRRLHWAPRRQARALVSEELAVVVGSLGDTLRDARDRSLLLVGFAGGFRRSELVGIDVQDLTPVPGGVFVKLRRSKTDQIGVGRLVAIPRGPAGSVQSPRWTYGLRAQPSGRGLSSDRLIVEIRSAVGCRAKQSARLSDGV